MDQKRDLESILDEVGYVGRAQIFYFSLILFITFFLGVQGLAHVFTAGDLNYRCHIDQCDSLQPVYNSEWLKYAVPFDDSAGLPQQCYKYGFIGGNDNSSDFMCTTSDFDRTTVTKCNKFVFENGEQTILTEFDLMCNENKWKLSLPATIQNTGMFVNLLIIGYISDRYGRKMVFVISPILGAIVGLSQPFAPNYTTFVVLKFIETLLWGGTYSSGVVLAIELVSPPHRAMIGTIIFMSASLGKAFLGLTAMYFQNWKNQTFFNFIPSFVALAYIWIIPESIKWLQVKRRYKNIGDILLRIIRWNNVQVSPEVKEMLRHYPETMAEIQPDKTNLRYPIRDVFKRPPMLLRIVMLSFCWITNVFVFYGLTLTSVSIGGNKYTNFMIANLMEVPACILVIIISHRVGRKKLICPSFILSGASLLIYPFVTEWFWIKLVVFMIGKFAITISFSTIYIFTSEVIPTNLRQTLVGVCSAIGRIGSIITPQVQLLDLEIKHLPIFLYCGAALTAGLLSLNFPETLNTKLPDSIEEALKIGKTKKSNNKQYVAA